MMSKIFFSLVLFMSFLNNPFFKSGSSFPLQAEDLWNGISIYSDREDLYKVGDTVIVQFQESVKFDIQLEKNQLKNLKINLVPDKLLFDYLPQVDDRRNSQKNQNFTSKEKVSFHTRLGMKIVNITGEQILLESYRQFRYNNVQYSVSIQGEANIKNVNNYKIDSSHLSSLVIQVSVDEDSNQNLQLEQERIILDEATKRKIFIEYLRHILQEQNINVP